MDANRFDTLLQSLSTAPSRRTALRLLAGSALGGLLGLGQLQTRAKNGKGKGGKGKGKGNGKGKKKCKDSSKITICHKGNTISVSNCAWKAHEKHGDTRGPCTTPPDPAGTCTATQEDFCQDADTVASACNGTPGCFCLTRLDNTRFCGRFDGAYCPPSDPSTACDNDADCLEGDACVQNLTVETCGGCGFPPGPICVRRCGN